MCALLIRGFSRCPVCEQLLDDTPFISTSSVAFPPEHRLYQYCDAGIHISCLEDWPERKAFAQGYFEQDYKYHASMPAGVLFTSDQWFIGVGPAKSGPTHYAEVRLRRWPIRLYSHWDDWNENVAGGFATAYSGPLRQEVETILNEVRQIAPTTDNLNRVRNSLIRRV